MDRRKVLGRLTQAPLSAAAADTIAPRPTTSAILGRVSSRDREEIVLEGGHVGIVVGRSASKDLWPRVAAWLAKRDA